MDASLPNRSSKNIGPFIQWMPHVLFCDQIPFGTDPLDKPREIKGVQFASFEDLMDFQSLLVKSGVLATGAPWRMSSPTLFILVNTLGATLFQFWPLHAIALPLNLVG